MLTRTARFIVCSAMALSSVVWAQAPKAPPTLDQRDSAKMQRSLTTMLLRAAAVPAKGKPPQPLRTTFTDRELNAWLTEDGKDNVPVGLVSPKVVFTGANTMTINGLVDLDAVRKLRERGRLDPMAYLTGLMAISMTGSLTGAAGQAIFDVQSASLGNVPVPKLILQELITYYSKSPQFPDGITLAKPFPLPAGVRDLAIQRGAATVVQ